MQRRPVCAIEDLPPGSMTLVQAGKFGVGVYNIDGALYAIANYCSHEGAPLCAGYVGGTNEFAPDMPGQLRHVRAGQVARCPWHQWEFDITTGVNLADPRKRVRTYEVDVADGQVYLTRMSPVIDAGVQPHFRYNAEIRRYLAPTHKLRSIPDVEQQWYQAPGGDYRQDLYGDGYPGSDPDTVAKHLFTEAGVDYAILNPLTRGNIADYLLNSRICAAVNDWLLDRWLEPDTTGRFRGTIRVNPEDVRGAVAEIERLADHPKMVQVGVPLQSREPYGKPMFEPIWEAAAAHGLPVAVHINGGNGVDHAPTFAGHAYTYPGYAAFMPLNSFVHLATLIIEGMFGRHPNLRFVFADGGYDILTPLMWRLDTFWMSMRDQTPWVDRYPSEYLPDHVRFCSSALDGPTDASQAERWLNFTDKADLLMYGSSYPHWSTSKPEDVVAGLNDVQREKVLWRNASDLYGVGLEVEGSLR